MAMFAPKPGCPMCSIVSQPYPSLLHSPRSAGVGPQGGIIGSGAGGRDTGPAHIIHKDENVTAYLERNNPVSSKGHVVIMLNLHVPSIYSFSSSDLPLLMRIQQLGHSLLTRHLRGDTFTALNSEPQQPTALSSDGQPSGKIHVGFIVSPFSDPKIPVKDHVHCHAYVGEMDKAGLWRKVNYSGLAWYAAEDLIAEIREQTSNNRIKSGYEDRSRAPINRVPDAGAAAGLPDGTLLQQPSIVPNVNATGPPPSPRSRPAAVTVPSIHEDTSFDNDPGTPKPGDSGPSPDSSSASVKSAPLSGRSSTAAGKRPMGPRTKDSMNSNSMQMSPVGTPGGTSSSSPEPVPAE